MDLLVLHVGATRVAVPLGSVREILRAVLITPLPAAPPVVEGIIAVRGAAVPVFDMRLRFGHPLRRLHPDDRLVLVAAGARLAALHCERADDIIERDALAITEAPAFREHDRLVAGVAHLSDGIAVVHDPAAFLDDAESIALDEAMARLGEDRR